MVCIVQLDPGVLVRNRFPSLVMRNRGAERAAARICMFLGVTSCAGTHEQAVRDNLSDRGERYTTPASSTHASNKRGDRFDGSLAGYVAYAMEKSPALRASFERWRASVFQISRTRRLPEPMLSFGYYIQSVETRVGPQQARISLQQSFPWPTKLTAGADASSAHARAQQDQFDARALVVSERVEQVYWRLWQIRRTRRIHAEHLEVLKSLSASVLARVATGTATLADQQQVDLAAARLEDMLLGMNEEERAAEAELRAVLGAPREVQLPTTDEPAEAGVPVESASDLAQSVQSHPLITSYGYMAEAEDERARAEEADRYPRFTLGADWIITGDAVDPTMPNSGKDAVIAGVGLSVPLWQNDYSDAVDAAHAEASARRSEQRAATDEGIAQLEGSLSAVRDAARRVHLYRHTLVPQAESAYESVLGAYAVGQGSVAQTLMSQRDLLELRVDLERARAEHSRSWAKLEQVVGRRVRRRDYATPGSTEPTSTSGDAASEGDAAPAHVHPGQERPTP